VLAFSAGDPSQGPPHTKDNIKMAPVVPLFSTQHRFLKKFRHTHTHTKKKKILHELSLNITINGKSLENYLSEYLDCLIVEVSRLQHSHCTFQREQACESVCMHTGDE